MRFATVLLALLVLTGSVAAATLDRTFSFNNVQVTEEDGYAIVELPGAPSLSEPGEPTLPVKGHMLLLPPGESLQDVVITHQRWLPLPGSYLPRPGNQMQPISEAAPFQTPPDPAIYEGDAPFPASIVSDLQTGFMRGHAIGSFLIHPVRWNPTNGSLEYLAEVSFQITTTPTNEAEAALELLRRDESTLSALQAITADLEMDLAYPTVDDNLDELDEPDPSILVIINANHEFAWEDYADWKYSRGEVVELLSTTDIYQEFDGDDNQEKIRNAIIDRYQTYMIEHVILGGDVAYIPYRGFYNQAWQGGEVDENIPADLYYAGLDGTWNDDGDNRWGESNESDLFQEVTIGRCPANSLNDVMTWTTKVMRYQDEPVEDEVLEALMVGEDLGWAAWGGDYKDQVAEGSSAHGYTTAGFTDDYNVQNLYDRNSTWSIPQLFNLLNSGVHFVNHLGHANVTYALKASNSHINTNNLTNDGINHSYYLLYTQGCYCGAFEQSSITEKWNIIPNGAFAVISNSRYGWGDGGGTDGPSQRYDREFFDAIYGEDRYILGDVNRDSKHDNIPYINYSCMRWCFYEINLFGDPTIDLYTDEPGEWDVDVPEVYVIGSPYLEITANEPWARVILSAGGEIIFTGMTDGSGNAMIPLELTDEEEIGVSMVAHNYVTYETTIPVTAAEGPYPLVSEVTVSDASGNDDGLADFGEDITLLVEFTNMGQDVLTSADVIFTSLSEDLTLGESTITVENVEPGETITVEQPAHVNVNVEDGTEVQVNAVLESETETWERSFMVALHAPRLRMAMRRIDDSNEGNGNCRIDPGETATVVMEFQNEGSSHLLDATLDAASDNPNVISVTPSGGTFNVLTETETILMQAFDVVMAEDTPEFYRAVFMVSVEREDGYLRRSLERVDIGGFYECVDGAAQDVQHYGDNGWNDEWHMSMERNFTADGSFSWKAGADTPGGDYADDQNAVLELPPVVRTGPITLTFRHWIEAEISQAHGGECYDGGLVEISGDGLTWMQIPMPGYNYSARGSGPFTEGTMLYSGNVEWERESFTVPYGPSDSLYFRFRFGSDTDAQNNDVYEGWYLDNISLTLGDAHETPLNLAAEVVHPGMVQLTWETPAPEVDDCAPLEGFLVYRNMEGVGDAVPYVEYYDDMREMPHGLYSYQVTALYSTGESAPTPAIEVNWDGSYAVDEDEAIIPTEWALESPYPNPFNPMASVRFGLPETAHVKAVVFNVLGQKVATLMDQPMQAGYHTMRFDGSDLASGMYFLTFQAGPMQETTRLILMK